MLSITSRFRWMRQVNLIATWSKSATAPSVDDEAGLRTMRLG